MFSTLPGIHAGAPARALCLAGRSPLGAPGCSLEPRSTLHLPLHPRPTSSPAQSGSTCTLLPTTNTHHHLHYPFHHKHHIPSSQTQPLPPRHPTARLQPNEILHHCIYTHTSHTHHCTRATPPGLQANEILHHKLTLNGYLAEFTGQSIEQITMDTDRDFFMSAQEAVEYGLIDAVVTKPSLAMA